MSSSSKKSAKSDSSWSRFKHFFNRRPRILRSKNLKKAQSKAKGHNATAAPVDQPEVPVACPKPSATEILQSVPFAHVATLSLSLVDQPSTPSLAHLGLGKEHKAVTDKVELGKEVQEVSREAKVKQARKSTDHHVHQLWDIKIHHKLVRAKLCVSKVKHQTNSGAAGYRPCLAAPGFTIEDEERKDDALKNMSAKKAIEQRAQLRAKMEQAERRRQDLLFNQHCHANLQAEKARRLAMKKQKDMLVCQQYIDKLLSYQRKPTEGCRLQAWLKFHGI